MDLDPGRGAVKVTDVGCVDADSNTGRKPIIRTVAVERSLDLDGAGYGRGGFCERYEIPVARTIDGLAQMLFDALNEGAIVPREKFGP